MTAAAAKSVQSCLTLCDPIDGSPPGSPVPGILQARTRVGCHFLLQCMKVKSEREVSQSYPTLSNPMDCSLPGSSTHGIFQARVGCHCLLCAEKVTSGFQIFSYLLFHFKVTWGKKGGETASFYALVTLGCYNKLSQTRWLKYWTFPGCPVVRNPPVGNEISIPGLGRFH